MPFHTIIRNWSQFVMPFSTKSTPWVIVFCHVNQFGANSDAILYNYMQLEPIRTKFSTFTVWVIIFWPSISNNPFRGRSNSRHPIWCPYWHVNQFGSILWELNCVIRCVFFAMQVPYNLLKATVSPNLFRSLPKKTRFSA